MPQKKRECIDLFRKNKLLDRQKYENKIDEIAPASGKIINQSDLELYTKLKGCNNDCNMFNPNGTKLNTYEITQLDKKKFLFDFTVKVDSNGALILDNPENDNGSNYCWLNAPLYAIVAYPDFLSFYGKECSRQIEKDSSVIFSKQDDILNKYTFTNENDIIDANPVVLKVSIPQGSLFNELTSKLNELYPEINFTFSDSDKTISMPNIQILKLKPLVNSEERKKL